MLQFKKFFSIILSFTLLIFFNPCQTVYAETSNSIPTITLSKHNVKADIGDAIYLIAVTSNGKPVTWKSSDSKIASVKGGVVTAKKAGTALITAKIKSKEAVCQISVNKTEIKINQTNVVIERGDPLKLSATTSNNSKVTWKSSKKSIATIDDFGTVTANKPGVTTIIAVADGSKATCIITIKSPIIELSRTLILLYRGQTERLSVDVSSHVNPKWKTSKKSVAVVDDTGTIIAIKNGSATITATVDGISKSCQVVVLKPEIKLSSSELYLRKGDITTISANVSSGNIPVWSSSNINTASVNSNGEITAFQTGTAYIYAAEDGTKVRCKIHITE